MLVLLSAACMTAKYPVEAGEDPDKPLIYKDSLASDKREQKKEKKIPAKTFYGLKTRKAFTKTQSRSPRVQTYELFYVLKQNLEVDPLVPERYWYHAKKRKLFVGNIPKKDLKYARVPHGPYKKIQNKKTVVEGIFYVGTKHGRWEFTTRNDDEILVDKQKWYKGWPRDAEMTYYDVEKKKVREVLPIVEGRYDGNYYRYFEDGVLAEEGKYEFGRKIGVWTEYFDNAKRKVQKKRMQYPATAWEYDEGKVPYRLWEADDNGTVIYDWDEEQKKLKDKKRK